MAFTKEEAYSKLAEMEDTPTNLFGLVAMTESVPTEVVDYINKNHPDHRTDQLLFNTPGISNKKFYRNLDESGSDRVKAISSMITHMIIEKSMTDKDYEIHENIIDESLSYIKEYLLQGTYNMDEDTLSSIKNSIK